MIEPIPLQAFTLYQNLLDAHLSRPGDETGARYVPFKREINGKMYWYANERVGGKVTQRYLGKDSPQLSEKLHSTLSLRETARDFERRATDMVGQLRAARFPTPDTVTGAMLVALEREGVFGLGGTIVGTHAFRLYEAELGSRVTLAAPAMTDDLNIASFRRLSLALSEGETRSDATSLADRLDALGLRQSPSMDPKGRSARWSGDANGAALDFLSPSFSDETELVLLEALGVWAQPLHFLNYLIADPIPAVALYRSGVLVRIPRPERFAVHKLIVAQRRSGPGLAKRRKDIAQATVLIEAMAQDRPYELARAYEDALAQGPKWQEALDRALKPLPHLAERLTV